MHTVVPASPCPTEVSCDLSSCRLWVGYQYVITGRNRSLEGHWEVAFKGKASWSFRRVVGLEPGGRHPDKGDYC